MSSVTARLPPGWSALVDPEWLRGWEPRSFALDGGATEVVAFGDGPPLLLIPGVPGFKEAWVGVLARLARRFRVITFDLRLRLPRPSWEQQLEDLERVADAYAPGEAFVAGHSLGGALAQRWALARPERVRALVLSSSFAALGGHSLRHWRKRYLEQLLVLASQRLLPESLAARAAHGFARAGAWVYDPGCDERLLGFVRFCIRHHSIAVARGCVRLAWTHDLRAQIDKLARPALVLVGERESQWALSASHDLRERIAGAELRVSPGASHLHPLSAPRWLGDAIESWLLERPDDRAPR